MAKLTSSDFSYVLTRPRQIFPIARQLSYPLTHILYYLPISPNQITALSMASGFAGARYFTQGVQNAYLMSALWLIVCYTLENCDGEIARLQAMTSE